MKVYTKEKRQAKHSLAWVLMETDSILIKGKRERFPNVRKGVEKGFVRWKLIRRRIYR